MRLIEIFGFLIKKQCVVLRTWNKDALNKVHRQCAKSAGFNKKPWRSVCMHRERPISNYFIRNPLVSNLVLGSQKI